MEENQSKEQFREERKYKVVIAQAGNVKVNTGINGEQLTYSEILDIIVVVLILGIILYSIYKKIQTSIQRKIRREISRSAELL